MIELEQGGGGFKNNQLIKELRQIINFKKDWTNLDDDSAVDDLGTQKLVFTTDAFIIDPIFFPGGDIGKIAACGTINDLAVMGAQPIGLSLSLVIEEGFSKDNLLKIAQSINQVSQETQIPIVTGDTKVIDKAKLDKIEITTAGIGLADTIINNNGCQPGDNIIVSGDLGEHGLTLLAHRFDYQTQITSDCQPLVNEISLVKKYLTSCKDPTRGGLAANLNEIADKSQVKIIINENQLPYKKEVVALTELLGLDIFNLPSEGRFIASVKPQDTDFVLSKLKKFNPQAKIIGQATTGQGLFLKTKIGTERKIDMPRGKLIPRIC